jgi:hypothetical protein
MRVPQPLMIVPMAILFRVNCVLLALLLALASSAAADPLAAGSPDAKPLTPETKSERQPRQVIFSSIELANGSTFVGSGFKRAFGPSVDAEGFVLMNLSGAGATPEIHQGPAGIRIRVARLTSSSSMLVGYQWVAPGRVFMLAAGPEASRRQQLDDGGRPRWQPTNKGVMLLAETWYEPRPWMMTQATLIHSSARRSFWVRAAAGLALRDGLFIGPEATAYAEEDYREARIGLHVTGIRIERFQLRLNAGISGVSNRRSGFYVGLSGHFKR